MYTALYYPHTSIESKEIVKTALLLWDKIEYLVPYEGFSLHAPVSDREMSEALEIIGAPHVPTAEEQDEAHEKISQLISPVLPSPFRYTVAPENGYELWPEKLAPKTWRLLADAGVIGRPLENSDFPSSRPAGLTIMSVLADCCAGNTKCRVTDENAAYAAIENFLRGENPRASDETSVDIQNLVPITIKTIDLHAIELRQLIDFRKRESAANGHLIRDLRHRYVDNLAAHAKELAAVGERPNDRFELERQFAVKMEDDLKFLKEELRAVTTEVLLSKEMLTAVLSSIGAIATVSLGSLAPSLGAAGVTLTVGGLVAARNKYAAARKAILQKHAMAYIYDLKRTP